MQRATGYVIYRALVVSLYLMKMLVVGEVPPPLKRSVGQMNMKPVMPDIYLMLRQYGTGPWVWGNYSCLFNAWRMRTRVTVVSLFVCLSVCPLPLYYLCKIFMLKNECTSQFLSKLQRFSTKRFR